ncbi:MAG: hypothetical protein ACJ796_08080 [Gemmatimonadaceae bacterium]
MPRRQPMPGGVYGLWLAVCRRVGFTGASLLENRIDQLTKEIAGRIRPVMAHISEEEFSQLVTRMAALQQKYELRTRSDFLGFRGNR